MNLPLHKCGLYLTHNEHRDLYQTALDYIKKRSLDQWENQEAKDIAIKTNEIWQLQWYPDTPIGSIVVQAPTLEALLAWANKQ